MIIKSIVFLAALGFAVMILLVFVLPYLARLPGTFWEKIEDAKIKRTHRLLLEQQVEEQKQRVINEQLRHF